MSVIQALFPPSTNDRYTGHSAAAWFLFVVGILTVVPGCIHYFLPDGGAHVIAGIDLSVNGSIIVAAFAWMGAMQIPHGLAELVVASRYRTLTPLFLALVVLECALMAFDGWFGKGARAAHHPPEHYGTVVVFFLGLIFFALSLPKRANSQSR